MSYKTPAELAAAACAAARAKCALTPMQVLLMGILGGAYISFGGFFYAVVTQDLAGYAGWGLTKFLGGAAFSLGLVLVVVGGGELFTGNCLMPLGVLSGCVPLAGMLRNWAWVYLSNWAGALLVAALVHFAGLASGAVGASALKIAALKMSLPPGQAFLRGVLCNWLVALAVWAAMAAQEVSGKILALFFPVTAFVASGFEHSIANMFFMTLGVLTKGDPGATAAAHLDPGKLEALSLGGYFHNLVPVTLGNIAGGVLFVAVFYYLIFRRGLESPN